MSKLKKREISGVFIPTFLLFVIFYIALSVFLAKAYRGKVLPEYYFLNSSLNFIAFNNFENEINQRLQMLESINFFHTNLNRDRAEFVNVSIKDSVELDRQIFINKKEYIFHGSWLQAYKIIFGFVKTKIDLGQKYLIIDESGLRQEYLQKDKDKVTETGSGNAQIILNKKGEIEIVPEKLEVIDNFSNIKNVFAKSLSQNTFEIPTYFVNTQTPNLTVEMWQTNMPALQELVKNNIQINLSFQNQKIFLNTGQILQLINIQDNKLIVDEVLLAKFTQQSFLNKYISKPVDAEFVYDDNIKRVIKFQKEIIGQKFDLGSAAQLLTKQMFIEKKSIANYNLKLTDDQPKIILKDLNNFGITDLLGTGYSSMRNSAPERYINIMNGINKLRGVLIAPGAEFSTISYLTPFTPENGYVEGLAIKKKKILPEIGGGMCQVSTTLFRAAMNSGLKITDRTNHSVVVNYYDDPRNGLPGTDATIYEPVLDFKFLNDTNAYILVLPRVVGNGEIYFDFWGTRDGRSGYFTPPQVLTRTESKIEPVYDLSDSLPEGVVKCSGPFNGATSVFTYIRTLSDGKVETVPYFSSYRPQGQNCLVGTRI